MKLDSVSTTIQTNSTSIESHEFKIGDTSTIIEILRNRLYGNPIQTITQEYISNARDSHRESKQTRPITITLPTMLDSVIKIRDYGIGLDKQKVCDVFVNYGTSTKRNDDNMTGGYGLGAKSAWAYTDSFCVVSFLEGKRFTYVAHTGNNKNGTFELIDESDTDEPNGVEIQIPVKTMDIQKFINAVYRTTYFWDNKPELKGITKLEIPSEYLNCAHKYKKDNVLIIKKNIFLFSILSTNYKDVFLLIDGIPYDLHKLTSSNYERDNKFEDRSSIDHAKHATGEVAIRTVRDIVNDEYITCISVENCDVKVAASREEIIIDKNNCVNINNFCKSAIRTIVEMVMDNFNRSDSLNKHIDIYEDMNLIFNYKSLPLTKDEKKIICGHTESDINFHFDFAQNYTCDNFTGMLVHTMKKNKNGNGIKIRSVPCSYITIDKKNHIVIVDGDFNVSKHIRGLFVNFDKDRIETYKIYTVICEQPYIEKIKNICQAILLSEIKIEKKNRNKNSANLNILRNDKEVKIRYLGMNIPRTAVINISGIVNKNTSEIENYGAKHILVPFSNGNEFDDLKFIKFIRLCKINSLEVIRCGKKDYKKLIKLSNVIQYEHFTNNLPLFFELSDHTLRKHAFRNLNLSLFAMRAYRESITCQLMQNLFDMYPKSIESFGRTYNCYDIPEEMLSEYYPTYINACNDFKIVTKMEDELLKKYVLLRDCDTKNLGEYVHYINSKKDHLLKYQATDLVCTNTSDIAP